MDKKTTIVALESLSKRYGDGDVLAVRGLSLSLEKGKIYALMGSSGCGKSTLLNLIGTLDTPDQGKIFYEGKTIESFASLSQFRQEFMGFVFQFHHLIPVLSLLENVETAMLFNPHFTAKQRRERAISLLNDMGLGAKVDRMATQISGGERQRASIARALANQPKLILADEPTGNVDSQTSIMILQKLRQFVEDGGSSMLIATHDPEVGKFADVIIRMRDGEIYAIENVARD